jgi:cytoskeletal protein RodZ
MAKGNKEKGKKIKLVVVFVVIIATSFLGFAGIFQPVQPPASVPNDNHQPVGSQNQSAQNLDNSSSSRRVGGINDNLK